MLHRTRSRPLSVLSTIGLLLGALVAVPSPAHAATLLANDFESAPVGEPPPGWTVADDGGPVAVETVPDGDNPTNRAMCVTRTTMDDPVSALHEFDSVSGAVTVEVRLRAAQTDALLYGPVLRDSQGRNIIQLGFHHENGHFSGLTSNWTGFVPYQADTWYDLRVEADTDTDTYDLYWNGTPVRQSEPFRNSADNLAEIRFNPYRWRLGAACYDDITITGDGDGDPEPPPDALLDDGFESGPPGEPPPGWSVTATGGSVETTTVPTGSDPDNRAMCVERTAMDTAIVASHGFGPASGAVTVEVRLRAGQTDALLYGPVLRDSQGRNIIQLGFHHENGHFSGLTSNWTGFVPYQADTWYDLRVEADTDTDTYDLYWNGTPVRQSEPFRNSADNLAEIRFNPYRWRLGAACYDDITITGDGDGDPEPPPDDWPEYPTNPFTFDLDFSVSATVGGIFAHDLTGDGLMDFVVTTPGHIGAYDNVGDLLWHHQLSGGADIRFWSGRERLAPAAIAGDIDGDGSATVMYISQDGLLRYRDGATGAQTNSHSVGTANAIAIANLRGLGDRDAILQYSSTEIRAIELGTGSQLWHTTNWRGTGHSIVRVADLDGDGRDDVLGPIILDHNGDRKHSWDLPDDLGTDIANIDSISTGDVSAGGPLEVALAEQRWVSSFNGNMGDTVVVNEDQILWNTQRPPDDIPPTGGCDDEKDPDKLAIGDFSPANAGLEVFARSACGNFPWVMDAAGEIQWTWNVADTAPAGWFRIGEDCPAGAVCDPPWSGGGIDVVTPVRWDAGTRDYLAVMERHTRPAKTAIVDPLTGDWLHSLTSNTARRLYVADVAGDYREEIIVVEDSRVRIFSNDEPNPDPDGQPRKWEQQHYVRGKQNYNYYAPAP